LRTTHILGYGELIEATLESPEWRMLQIPAELQDWIAAADAATERPYREAWAETVNEVEQLLRAGLDGISQGSLAVDRETLADIGCFDAKMLGAGTVTAAGSIFLASRHAAQPAQGLVAAAFARGADTDTLACMTGALLGSVNGTDWLAPLLGKVQDGRYVRSMADQLVGGGRVPDSMPPEWRSTTPRRFWKEFELAHPGMDVLLPDGRAGTVIETIDHASPAPLVSARTWVVHALDGQTLYLKHVRRLPKQVVEEPAPIATSPSTSERSHRVGVVLRVRDLQGLRAFYQDLVGLRVSRESPTYTTFEGVLALEETAATQLELADEVPAKTERFEARVSLTVFLDRHELDVARRRLKRCGVSVSDLIEKNGRRAFRCLDPEKNVIEFRELSQASATRGESPTGDQAQQ